MAEKKTIALSGMVTPEDVDGLPTCATLDFKDVTSVSFAGLRALLKLQEAEEGIDIVSASNEVYLLFDSTGARRFIPIMMQPREFDLSSYHVAGDSNQGDCYFDNDGDSMVKVYKTSVLLASARREQRGAYAAFVSGVPTPLVGGEVSADGRPGILFELARNKKSFTRMIADDPDNIEEYVATFSKLARELHETPCETSLVAPTSAALRMQAEKCPFLSDERRERLLGFIDGVEPSTACNHGDLQDRKSVV